MANSLFGDEYEPNKYGESSDNITGNDIRDDRKVLFDTLFESMKNGFAERLQHEEFPEELVFRFLNTIRTDIDYAQYLTSAVEEFRSRLPEEALSVLDHLLLHNPNIFCKNVFRRTLNIMSHRKFRPDKGELIYYEQGSRYAQIIESAFDTIFLNPSDIVLVDIKFQKIDEVDLDRYDFPGAAILFDDGKLTVRLRTRNGQPGINRSFYRNELSREIKDFLYNPNNNRSVKGFYYIKVDNFLFKVLHSTATEQVITDGLNDENNGETISLYIADLIHKLAYDYYCNLLDDFKVFCKVELDDIWGI